jgi:hypothetical protein
LGLGSGIAVAVVLLGSVRFILVSAVLGQLVRAISGTFASLAGIRDEHTKQTI